MDNKKAITKYYIFASLFVLFNILSTYIVTTESLNHYITTFNYTAIGVFNSFIGNLTFLLFVIFIINLFTKNLNKRAKTMLIITFILNGFLFWINIFNRFYGTQFTFKAFQIFKNPAGNFGLTIFFEAMKEIVTYFRIILFIPLILLLVVYRRFKLNKEFKGKYVEFNFQRYVSHFLTITLMLFLNLVLFTKTTHKVDIVESAKPTYASQNLGLYNYLVLNAVGFDYNIEADLDTLEIYDKLNTYNKNYDTYLNKFDNKLYNKSVKIEDINITGDLIESHNDEYLTGILKDYNLSFVHLETFNYFVLENMETKKYLYNLEALLKESYVFDNFYTNVGLGNSSDAELSVLTGLYANGTSTIFWDFDELEEETNFDLQTLPKLFKEENYKTTSYHGNTGDFYNRDNVHHKMLGFDKFESRDKILNNTNLTLEEVIEKYEHDAGIWLSDRFTVEYFNDEMFNEDEKFFNFLITMLPHTPFYYDPYNPKPKESNMYSDDFVKNVSTLSLKYFNYLKYFNEIIGLFTSDKDGNLHKKDKTAYIFYGDHGTSLKFDDVNYLFNNELSDLEVKQKLLQTLAFIYVPGENETTVEVSNGKKVNLYEGLLKGKQSLVRDQIDLYRTIVDLYDLNIKETDFLFGTHGMSLEPSFALDNKSLNLITDDFVSNLSNNRVHYINNQITTKEINEIKNHVAYFKKYNDYALNNNLYKDFK